MFRSDAHNVFTEEVNKIALSANNDQRIHKYLMDISIQHRFWNSVQSRIDKALKIKIEYND